MNDKRRVIKEHISAARDWLGRAESSIDKENDVRGDLDVMLAQAELQRAQETKYSARWRKLFIRLAPLVVAVFVALGYVMLLRSEKTEETGTTSVPVVTAQERAVTDNNKSLELPDRQEVHETSGRGTSMEVVATFPKETDDSSLPDTEEHEVEKSSKQEIKETTEKTTDKQSAPADRPLEKVRTIPAAQLQELMLRAGKSLRE